MIFVRYKAVLENKAMVEFEHYMPLDPVQGMGMTEEELQEMGLLVDALPVQEPIPGKIATLYCNPSTKEFWYEYADTPPTETQLQEQIKTAQNTINALGQELVVEKLKDMEKEAVIQTLGQELAGIKLELMNLKGGA